MMEAPFPCGKVAINPKYSIAKDHRRIELLEQNSVRSSTCTDNKVGVCRYLRFDMCLAFFVSELPAKVESVPQSERSTP